MTLCRCGCVKCTRTGVCDTRGNTATCCYGTLFISAAVASQCNDSFNSHFYSCQDKCRSV